MLFIYPDLNIDVGWRGHYYEGIAMLSAVLKSKGHYVKLAHIYNLERSKDIIKEISAGFDLVAFSSTTPMFPYVQFCSKIIKKHFKEMPLLCGGAHATAVPEEALKTSDVDYACIGEGEYFILDFLEYLQGSRAKDDIKNLAYKTGSNEVKINEVRPPINPLDDLPFPDRGLFDLQHWNTDSADISAGRGCPYKCAYCSNDYLNQIYKNKYLRFRKPETVIREIETLLKRYPSIKQLMFLDDIFLLDREWLSGFCKLYSNSFKLPFNATAHPEIITDERIKMVKEAGCREIDFGIQSGNEAIRNNIMLRHGSNDKIKESIRILKKHGIRPLVDIIFGVPAEKKTQMLDTIKICAENKVRAKSHIFYPLPATRLEELSIQMSLYDKNTYGEDYHSRSILKYSKLHKTRILFFHRYSNVLILIYSILGYSLTNIFSRKMCLYALDKILCNDLVICFIVAIRSTFMKIRSFIRKIYWINEYRLTQLKDANFIEDK